MVSVTRPLVDSLAHAADPDRWLAGLISGLPPEGASLVERAFHTAREHYGDDTLPPVGERLFTHAVAAAAIVADMELLADAIAATLLFAMPDYRGDYVDWLKKHFTPTVAELVQGVSRIRLITLLASQDRE